MPNTMSLKCLIEELLQSHNMYRYKHEACPLTLDMNLTCAAQQWAEHLAANGEAKYSPCSDCYGENIAVVTNANCGGVSGQSVSDAWYKEGCGYNYCAEPTCPNARHFTQMIWASSRKVGFGAAIGCNGNAYVVARYQPKGNIPGQYRCNVKPPSS